MNLQKLTILTILGLLLGQIISAQKEPKLVLPIGHTRQINSVCFSPDGKYALSGSSDNTIILWDMTSGKELISFKGHISTVTSISYSPDGKTFISGSGDNTVKLWDIDSGKEIKTFKGHTNGVTSVSYSPDGKTFISGSGIDFFAGQGEIKLWDIESGKEIKTFKGHTKDVSVTYSPDGKSFISGSDDKIIKLWDIDSGKILKSFKGHTDRITSVSFSLDGKTFISGSRDKTIKLWDIESGKELKSFTGHYGYVESLSYSPDGKTFISGSGYPSNPGEIKQWDIESGKELKSFEGNTAYVTSVSFSLDGKTFISGGGYYGKPGEVKLWDITSGKELKSIVGHTETVYSVSYSPDGKTFISGGGNYSKAELKLRDLATGKEIKKFSGHTGYVQTISFSPDGKTFLSGSWDNTIKLWDIASGKEIKSYEGNTEKINSISYSPDGKTFISCSGIITKPGEIKLWDIASGKEMKSFVGHKSFVASVSYSPDGKTFISGSDDNTIKLWNIESGKELKSFNASNVTTVSYSPDGKTFISCSYNWTIKLWDITSGKELKSFKGHTHRVSSVSYSPDGKTFISGSWDNTIKLWDLASGKELKSFEGHTDHVISVSYSPDGKTIISSSNDNTIKLWDIASSKELCSLISVDEDDWLVVTPDGRFDGSDSALDMLYYVKGLEIIPLSSLFEQYYTPNLFARIMEGEEFEETEVKINDIKLPPQVVITSPENNNKSNSKEVTISIKVTDQGGGIDEIRLYHNGKLVETTQRGFKPVENKDVSTKTFTINLSEGENKIKATAFNNQRTEAIPNEITLYYEGAKAGSDLYVMVVGLDKYKNSKYNLNYAVADATAFKEAVENGSNTIFGSVNITFIQDENATRTKILQEFEKLKNTAKQEDVFILYYAGHGVMSEEKKAQFYIVPYDVTQLYGNNELLKTKAVSAEELQDFSAKLKAQKQLFIFDACQSGGMTDLLASRGAAEEKAIAQLARSTGTFWLTASNSEQFATEFAELGHGLFTYTILLGLQGKADGGSKDRKITVKELSSFLDDMVPELSEKHKGEAQYPSIYGYGMDFPIIIIK